MIRKLKRIVYFFCVFSLLSTILVNAELVSSAEVIWEENYYKTQLEYYAGEASTKSAYDSSFSDWKGEDLVEINSAEHPENWQSVTHTEDFTYSYALSWDTTNIYLYIEIDKPMASLNTSITRFYFDITPVSYAFTGFVEYGYDSETGCFKVSRAERYRRVSNDVAFTASIGLHSDEINEKTYVEISVPWSGMNQEFTPTDGKSVKYNICMLPEASSTYLYAQDTSVWTVNNMPWQTAKYYPTMYFKNGTPSLTLTTPIPLSTSEILTSSYKEVNAALGKTYTGTIGTNPKWSSSNQTLLTEGSFQDFSTISGDYMEGFQGKGIDGTKTADLEDDGTIVKIIDLGSVVSGLYKFKTGASQVLDESILFPSEVKIYASENGSHYQYLGIATADEYEISSDTGTLKEMQKYVVTLTEGINARYIKVKITPSSDNYEITAVSEITAVYNKAISESNEPIISLGAKVNKELKGLRFGAQFNKKENKEVDKIGMLIYPTAKLGSNTLNMEYYLANSYSEENQSGVVMINAVAISNNDYVEGKAFGSYDSFVYFVTLLNIPDSQLSTNITAVPFIIYSDSSIVYGNQLERNYNDVLSATDSIEE